MSMLEPMNSRRLQMQQRFRRSYSNTATKIDSTNLMSNKVLLDALFSRPMGSNKPCRSTATQVGGRPRMSSSQVQRRHLIQRDTMPKKNNGTKTKSDTTTYPHQLTKSAGAVGGHNSTLAVAMSHRLVAVSVLKRVLQLRLCCDKLLTMYDGSGGGGDCQLQETESVLAVVQEVYMLLRHFTTKRDLLTLLGQYRNCRCPGASSAGPATTADSTDACREQLIKLFRCDSAQFESKMTLNDDEKMYERYVFVRPYGRLVSEEAASPLQACSTAKLARGMRQQQLTAVAIANSSENHCVLNHSPDECERFLLLCRNKSGPARVTVVPENPNLHFGETTLSGVVPVITDLCRAALPIALSPLDTHQLSSIHKNSSNTLRPVLHSTSAASTKTEDQPLQLDACTSTDMYRIYTCLKTIEQLMRNLPPEYAHNSNG